MRISRTTAMSERDWSVPPTEEFRAQAQWILDALTPIPNDPAEGVALLLSVIHSLEQWCGQMRVYVPRPPAAGESDE